MVNFWGAPRLSEIRAFSPRNITLDFRRFTVAAWVKIDPGSEGVTVIRKVNAAYDQMNYFFFAKTTMSNWPSSWGET